jgi:hypothetical protein
MVVVFNIMEYKSILVCHLYTFLIPGIKVFLTDLDPHDHESVVVRLRSSEPWVTLPCPVSNKDAYVRLYKLLPKV